MIDRLAATLIEQRELQFTLMDIGASGQIYRPFRPLIGSATYVGFDPDLRDMQVESHGDQRRIVLNKAVTADADREEVTFYLTAAPHCSSTLEPDPEAVGQWPYAPGFTVERTVDVPAMTMEDALREAKISHIDWLKIDSQGTDARIIRSIPRSALDQLLICDSEPGMYHHYRDSDLISTVHDLMVAEGFWLADIHLQTQPRVSAESYEELLRRASGVLGRNLLRRSLRRAPTAPELRYIRTIESAVALGYNFEQFLRLFVIAVQTGNSEFGFDIARTLESRFPSESSGLNISERTARQIRKKTIPRAALNIAERAIEKLRGGIGD
jgi:FkbM family methyltransferase